jgi:hypothetical protein
MTLLLRISLAGVAVSAALALSVPSFAGSKVDLTAYVIPQPVAGDFKVFEFGDQVSRRISVLSVSPWKKRGWQAVLSQEETGLATGALRQFVVPGRKSLIGEVAAAELAVDFTKPTRLFKLRTLPGKLNRFRMSGTAYFGGNPVGRGKYSGTWQLLGFQDVATPTADWMGAARIHLAGSLRIKIRENGNVVQAFVERTAWFAEGVGEVANEESTTLLVNGVQQAQTGPRRGWLDSGMWRGLPIP